MYMYMAALAGLKTSFYGRGMDWFCLQSVYVHVQGTRRKFAKFSELIAIINYLQRKTFFVVGIPLFFFAFEPEPTPQTLVTGQWFFNVNHIFNNYLENKEGEQIWLSLWC